MPAFKATEFSVTEQSITPTGNSEIYLAATIEEAVQACLYTKGLAGDASIGPSGKTVNCGGISYTITPDKDKPVHPKQRIRMGEMKGDPHPIPQGTEGTVENVVWVQNSWHISVKWDNGRTLAICNPPDTFDIVG